MIKKLVMVSCMALAMTGAYAQTSTSTSGSISGSNSANDSSNRTRVNVDAGSTSGSISGSSSVSNGNTGIEQANIFTAPEKTETNVHYSGDQTIKNVPSVNAPPLVTSNDTCMGSTSFSANGAGFGVGIGSTWTDDNCIMLKNSRELWNMGMKAASMALMCTDIRTRRALEVTGFNCPNVLDGTPKPVSTPVAAGKSAAAEQPQYTDPIIRARLGLPPLTTASK